MEGLTKEGGLNIVENFAAVTFAQIVNQPQISAKETVMINVRELLWKFGECTNSIFVNGVLKLIMSNLNTHFSTAPQNNKDDISAYSLVLQ
jgi:hypothetical protein